MTKAERDAFRNLMVALDFLRRRCTANCVEQRSRDPELGFCMCGAENANEKINIAQDYANRVLIEEEGRVPRRGLSWTGLRAFVDLGGRRGVVFVGEIVPGRIAAFLGARTRWVAALGVPGMPTLRIPGTEADTAAGAREAAERWLFPNGVPE